MTEKILIKQHQGLARRIKYAMPSSVFNMMRPALNTMATLFPDRIKYAIGSRLKKHKYPYCVIEAGDVVVQVGAPRDLLQAGRSRAMHFAWLVKHGKVVVIEPDPHNCDEIKTFVANNNLHDTVILVEKGVWSEAGELELLSSSKHPAANILVAAKDINQTVAEERQYSVIKVPVATLDEILEDLNLRHVRLVSLTTNGAEPNIVRGMKKLLTRGPEYISLASTKPGYPELMRKIGYQLTATDDRGYSFRRNSE